MLLYNSAKLAAIILLTAFSAVVMPENRGNQVSAHLDWIIKWYVLNINTAFTAH